MVGCAAIRLGHRRPWGRQTRGAARKRRWIEEAPQIHTSLASAEEAEEESLGKPTPEQGGGGDSTTRTHAAVAQMRACGPFE